MSKQKESGSKYVCPVCEMDTQRVKPNEKLSCQNCGANLQVSKDGETIFVPSDFHRDKGRWLVVSYDGDTGEWFYDNVFAQSNTLARPKHRKTQKGRCVDGSASHTLHERRKRIRDFLTHENRKTPLHRS